MKRVPSILARWILWLQSRIVLSAWKDEQAQVYLGRMMELMTECANRARVADARKRYRVHPTARWNGTPSLCGDGEISIDEQTYIGDGSEIVAHPSTARIAIGRFCAISRNVHIRTEGYRTDVSFEEARRLPGKWANIEIGDFVWIGANAFICGGVKIGDNSVIGANSVVTKNVPPHAIVAGVPAKLLKYKSHVGPTGYGGAEN